MKLTGFGPRRLNELLLTLAGAVAHREIATGNDRRRLSLALSRVAILQR